MSTSTVDTNAATLQQNKLDAEKQQRMVEDAVAKFLSNDAHSAVAYKPQTLVNNVWEELEYVLSQAFEVQDEHENATNFRIAFLVKACLSQAKVEARSRVNEFEREIDAWSREHKTVKLSREEIASEVIKTRSGKRMKEMADAGKAFIDSLK